MDITDLRAQLSELHTESFGWTLNCCEGNLSQAEDVLQSAYLKILNGKARFEERSTFKTWLFGVIRNSAREERRRVLLRRVGLLRYEPNMTPSVSPDAEFAEKESSEYIRSALSKLSQRQREVLHLVFYQDLTIEEASKIMSVPNGTARKHYQRGKDQLRKHLRNEER
jgi:RNA polymerase sigma factor (sigma-70 family)